MGQIQLELKMKDQTFQVIRGHAVCSENHEKNYTDYTDVEALVRRLDAWDISGFVKNPERLEKTADNLNASDRPSAEAIRKLLEKYGQNLTNE